MLKRDKIQCSHGENESIIKITIIKIFDRKPGFLKAIFDKELTPFWKTFLEMKQLLNA